MKLSVAMCTYNGAKYINAQLDSILNQTIPVDQIIICDDGSKDATAEIVAQYQAENPGIITFIINSVNLKSNKNFEKAISFCDGDYIFFSDQDDTWRDDKVEKTLAVFKENPTAEGVFSNAGLINENGGSYSNYTLWDIVFFLENELPAPIDIFDVIKRKGNVVTGATLCVKNNVLKSLVPFPDSKHILHDGWIALSLSFKKTLFYSRENLINYRIHPEQQIGGSRLDKIEKTKALVRNIFELSSPKTFNDYKKIHRKYCFNLEQFRDIESFVKDKNFFDYNQLISDNLNSIHKVEKTLKSQFYTLFILKILKNIVMRNGKRI